MIEAIMDGDNYVMCEWTGRGCWPVYTWCTFSYAIRFAAEAAELTGRTFSVFSLDDYRELFVAFGGTNDNL